MDKEKTLIEGDFKNIQRETKKYIILKNYKKSILILDKYNEQQCVKNKNSKITIVEKIIINKQLVKCINQQLKIQLIEADIEYDGKAVALLERSIRAVTEWYRFIMLYTRNIQNNENLGNIQDQSFLSSDDEYQEYTMNHFKIDTWDKYEQQYEFKNHNQLKQQFQQRKEHFSLKKIELYTKNSQQNPKQKIKIYREMNQFFIHLFDLLVNHALVYKRLRHFKTYYWYLAEAETLSNTFKNSINGSLLDRISRIKILMSTFYYEAGKYQQAQIYAEDALQSMQCQLRTIHIKKIQKNRDIRLKPRKYQIEWQKMFEQKEAKIYRQYIITLQHLALLHEEQKNIYLLNETMTYIEWSINSFLKSMDEVKKWAQRLILDFKIKYKVILEQEGDIRSFAMQNFDLEITQIFHKLDQQKIPLEDQKLYEQNLILYKKFNNRAWNSAQCYKYKDPPQQIDTFENQRFSDIFKKKDSVKSNTVQNNPEQTQQLKQFQQNLFLNFDSQNNTDNEQSPEKNNLPKQYSQTTSNQVNGRNRVLTNSTDISAMHNNFGINGSSMFNSQQQNNPVFASQQNTVRSIYQDQIIQIEDENCKKQNNFEQSPNSKQRILKRQTPQTEHTSPKKPFQKEFKQTQISFSQKSSRDTSNENHSDSSFFSASFFAPSSNFNKDNWKSQIQKSVEMSKDEKRQQKQEQTNNKNNKNKSVKITNRRVYNLQKNSKKNSLHDKIKEDQNLNKNQGYLNQKSSIESIDLSDPQSLLQDPKKALYKESRLKIFKNHDPNYIPKSLTTNKYFKEFEPVQVQHTQKQYKRQYYPQNPKKIYKEEQKQQQKDSIQKNKFILGMKRASIPVTKKLNQLELKQQHQLEVQEYIKEINKQNPDFKKMLEKYDRGDEINFSFMDKYMDQEVKYQLQKRTHNKDTEIVSQLYENFCQKEDFDKKEFKFGKKQLQSRQKENLPNGGCEIINHTKTPNKITLKKIEDDNIYSVEATNNLKQEYTHMLKQKENQKVQILLKLGIIPDEEKFDNSLKQLYEKKKKISSLRELILRHRENLIFKEARYLKTVFYQYQEEQREIEQKLKKQSDKEKDQQHLKQQLQILSQQQSKSNFKFQTQKSQVIDSQIDTNDQNLQNQTPQQNNKNKKSILQSQTQKLNSKRLGSKVSFSQITQQQIELIGSEQKASNNLAGNILKQTKVSIKSPSGRISQYLKIPTEQTESQHSLNLNNQQQIQNNKLESSSSQKQQLQDKTELSKSPNIQQKQELDIFQIEDQLWHLRKKRKFLIKYAQTQDFVEQIPDEDTKWGNFQQINEKINKLEKMKQKLKQKDNISGQQSKLNFKNLGYLDKEIREKNKNKSQKIVRMVQSDVERLIETDEKELRKTKFRLFHQPLDDSFNYNEKLVDQYRDLRISCLKTEYKQEKQKVKLFDMIRQNINEQRSKKPQEENQSEEDEYDKKQVFDII